MRLLECTRVLLARPALPAKTVAGILALDEERRAALSEVDRLTLGRAQLLAIIEDYGEELDILGSRLGVRRGGEIADLVDAERAKRRALEEKCGRLEDRLKAILETINSPLHNEWLEAVRIESGHQVLRYPPEHDANKTALDWFWLIGYLAQKAVFAALSGDLEKAKHHTISTGAALFNWHRHIQGGTPQGEQS